MHQNLIQVIYDIAVKARIFRVWQDAHAVRPPQIGEREILALEVVKEFAPMTEQELGRVFGLPGSSVSDLVKRLTESGLLNKGEKCEHDKRARPLSFTPEGEDALTKAKEGSARRFEYLLGTLTDEQQETLLPILGEINRAADTQVRQLVFGEYHRGS